MKMKAIIMTRHGGPEVLDLVEIERPELVGPHDVLVRVHADGVNYGDIHVRNQRFEGYEDVQAQVDVDARSRPFKEASGLVLGLDGAGIVEAVGSAVKIVSKGDKVYYVDGGFGPHQGSYAEFKVVDEHYLAPKPASLDLSTAAAAPTAVITAWEGLYDRIEIKPGQFVVVHGGAGGVGHFGVQLAKRRGARVAATVSTDAKAALAQKLGAERTIRYREEDITAALQGWTGKAGADVVFDRACRKPRRGSKLVAKFALP